MGFHELFAEELSEVISALANEPEGGSLFIAPKNYSFLVAKSGFNLFTLKEEKRLRE